MNANERVYRNTKALAAMNDMPMADLEKKLGKAAGYLSRKRTRVDVDTLMAISEIFGVMPEELMRNDYERELHAAEATKTLEQTIISSLEYLSPDLISKLFLKVLDDAYDKDGDTDDL